MKKARWTTNGIVAIWVKHNLPLANRRNWVVFTCRAAPITELVGISCNTGSDVHMVMVVIVLLPMEMVLLVMAMAMVLLVTAMVRMR